MTNTYHDSFVSIVILNYNGRDYIEKCLDSVFKTTGCKFEVILIDNGSTDGSQQLCKEKFPKIRLFQNKENIAMAARNIGIDNAKGNFVAFLDSDATVDPSWLQNLIQSYNMHGPGLYQAKILEQDDHTIIGSAGNLLNIFGFGFARGNGTKDTGQYDQFERVSFPVGACLFSSLDIIKQVGYFDESKLLYLMYDDVDYGWKALTRGIYSFYEPKSIIYHPQRTGSKLDSHKTFLLERNRWICLLSYYSSKTMTKLIPLFLVLEFGLFFYLVSKGKGMAKIKAFFSILKMNYSIKQRKKIMSKRKKLSDKDMVSCFVDNLNVPETTSTSSNQNFFGNVIMDLSKFARRII